LTGDKITQNRITIREDLSTVEKLLPLPGTCQMLSGTSSLLNAWK